MENVIIRSELTAISTGVSQGAKAIVRLRKGLHKGASYKVLDYGCGTGRNMAYIQANGIKVDGCDIMEQLSRQKNKHDILREKGCKIVESKKIRNNTYKEAICSHVLNVIESDSIKLEVLKDIYKKLKKDGICHIEVRTKNDIEKAKTKVAHGDGYLMKKGSKFTYQEAITKEKMCSLVEKVGFEILAHEFYSNEHYIMIYKK